MRHIDICTVSYTEWNPAELTYSIHVHPRRHMKNIEGHCRYSLTDVPCYAFTAGLVYEWLREVRSGSGPAWWVLSFHEYQRK